MKERNIDPKKFEPRSILAGISNAKNELLSADKYAKKITIADPYEKINERCIYRISKTSFEK